MTSLLPNLCIKLSKTSSSRFFHCFSNINNHSEVYLENLAVHWVYGRCKRKYGMINEIVPQSVRQLGDSCIGDTYKQWTGWSHAVLHVVSNSQRGMRKPWHVVSATGLECLLFRQDKYPNPENRCNVSLRASGSGGSPAHVNITRRLWEERRLLPRRKMLEPLSTSRDRPGFV